MPSLQLTDDQARVLKGSQQSKIVAIPYYNGRRNGEELPVVGGQLEDDGEAEVTRTLSLLIADRDGSLVPRKHDDPLAPFGSRLYIATEHQLGDLTIRLPYGWFQIQKLPDYLEQKDRYSGGQWAHRGASINVKANGLFQINADEKFEAPLQSPVGPSTYAEARRLSRIPITTSLPDKPITAVLNHDDSPLAALQLLAENLDGIAYETADGTWSVRPKVDVSQTDPVWQLEFGSSGGIVTPPRTLSRDGFANAFIVRNESNTTGPQIQGRAVIEAGPLAYGGPMGRIPRVINNPLMTSSAMAAQAAKTIRDKALRGQPFELTIQCVPNPTLIPGDVVEFAYFEKTLNGEVLKSTVPHLGMQTLDLLVDGGTEWA